MVCRQTGYSRHRLNILLADPTFQELIASYNAEFDEKVREDLDVYDELQRRNMIRSEMLISERLENEDEPPPLHILDRISQNRADRTGYGKNSTIKHEHSFAEALDKAIERSGKARVIEHVPSQIEAQPVPQVPTRPHATPKAVEPHPPKPSFKRVLTKT